MADAAPARVRVPRMISTSTSMWLSIAVAVVGGIGVVIWALLTQPPANQAATIVGVVVLVLLFGVLGGRRTSLDTVRGAVVRDVWGLFPRSEAWAGADVVRIRSNNAGQTLLEIRGAGRRTSVQLPLAAVDLGGERSQSPEFLRTLAEQIEQWGPERGPVVTSLRAQADHLDSGGSVTDSPLARRYLASAGRGSRSQRQS